jgi:hypothetical protein
MERAIIGMNVAYPYSAWFSCGSPTGSSIG